MSAAAMSVTGETQLAAVIGDPVRHSRSPAIHNAAYAASGLDWVFVALEVPEGRGYDAVRAMSVLGLDGLSVTMPHKADAARACDELSADATALEVVNTVVPRDRRDVVGRLDGRRGAHAQPGRRGPRPRRPEGARARRRRGRPRRGARPRPGRGPAHGRGPPARRGAGRRPAGSGRRRDRVRRRPRRGTSTSCSTRPRSGWPASRSRSRRRGRASGRST